MLSRLFGHRNADPSGLLTSQLYSNENFYATFGRDLERCQYEVIIESPFMTTKRTKALLPSLTRLSKRGVRLVVNTKPPEELEGYLRFEAEVSIGLMQGAGVTILYTGGHHRKLAILDRAILWEGSLNILSQNDSCEVMRRIESVQMAEEMAHFVGIERFL
jgi:hypothetical protein